MNLCYATTARLPTFRAHGLQILESCAAFAACGVDVRLVAAARRAAPGLRDDLDPRDHAGVGRTFPLLRSPAFELGWRPRWFEPMSFRLMSLTFGLGLDRTMRQRVPDDAVLYSRDPLPLVVAGRRPARIRVWEAHQLPAGRPGHAVLGACVRSVDLVVAVTERIAAAVRTAGARRVVVARDGFRPDRFANVPSRAQARRDRGLPDQAFVVGYVGQMRTLAVAKGVEQLVDAVATLGDGEATLVVVGGSAAETAALRERWLARGGDASRLVAPGQVDPAEVPAWIAAFDAAVVPLPSTPHFSSCASPLKLFEYLAAGRAVVASDLPALAEVVSDGDSAVLTAPGDADDLRRALRRLATDHELRRRLEIAGRRLADGYSWDRRCRRILSEIEAVSRTATVAGRAG